VAGPASALPAAAPAPSTTGGPATPTTPTTPSATTSASVSPTSTTPTPTTPVAPVVQATPGATDTAAPTQPVVATATAVQTVGTEGGDARSGHGSDGGTRDQGDPRLQSVTAPRGGEGAFAVPAASTTASVAPAAATAGSATANAPVPLQQQLSRPVFALAQAGPGEHVVTVQVTPDALGPVTVRAHVTAHGMHVELFAASDAGRDAVRQVLPDLRRDAAGSALSTTLDLSSQNHPDARSGQDDRPTPAGPRLDPGQEARPTPRAPGTAHTPTVRSVGLDVLA
uniref:flagellar hook-length control protein FliK n=1 Tax=unclassified Curtobacterium TaxID=257496 RepID=UPI003A80F084